MCVKLPGDSNPPIDNDLLNNLINWLHKMKSVPPKGVTKEEPHLGIGGETPVERFEKIYSANPSKLLSFNVIPDFDSWI